MKKTRIGICLKTIYTKKPKISFKKPHGKHDETDGEISETSWTKSPAFYLTKKPPFILYVHYIFLILSLYNYLLFIFIIKVQLLQIELRWSLY